MKKLEVEVSSYETLDYGTVCEMEYIRTDTGAPVGYWAYGQWDPGMPYQGEDLFFCETCGGCGEVHSHNPICWTCGGCGLVREGEKRVFA